MAKFPKTPVLRACTQSISKRFGSRAFSSFCQLVQFFQSVLWVSRDSLMLIRSSEAMVFSCFVATKLCVLWISLVCHGMSKLRNQQNMVVVDLRGEDRASGHIAGTVHVPAMDLLKEIQKFVEMFSDQPIVAFLCQYSAHRAPTAAGWIVTTCLLCVFVFCFQELYQKPLQERQFQQGKTKATRSPTSTERAAQPSSA